MAGVERNLGQVKDGGTHVDRHAAIGLVAEGDDASVYFDPNVGAGGQPSFFDKAHKATGPIATLLHFAAIGVVDDVFKIGFGGGADAHAEDLIGTDAVMPIGQKPVLLGAEAKTAFCLIKDNKVVSCPLHFGEWHSHGPHY